MGMRETPGPMPGDVFRVYHLSSPAGILWSDSPELAYTTHDRVDLDNAVRAEIGVELANQHLGYTDQWAQVNGREKMRMCFPQASPQQPSPSLYYHFWSWMHAVDIGDLLAGAINTVQLTTSLVGYDGVKENHPPPCTLVGTVFLRVYYGSAKPHVSGRLDSPSADQALGEHVFLSISTSGVSDVARVDYVGRMEDLNYRGDGVYNQWHYRMVNNAPVNILGSSPVAPFSVDWDARWAPDQDPPFEIAAWITDGSGLTSMTPAVGGLRFSRPFGVSLIRAGAVPTGYSACHGEDAPWSRTQMLDVPIETSAIQDARLWMPVWNAPENKGFTLNGVELERLPADTDRWKWFQLTGPVRPLSAIRKGKNEIRANSFGYRGMDIYFPGVQMLIRHA